MSKFRIKIKAQELRAAQSISGKTQPCSGALFFAKGDALGDNYLAECKRTDKKSISVKASVLAKITKEASMQGRLPLLFLELDMPDFMVSKSWVCMEESTFRDLTDRGKK